VLVVDRIIVRGNERLSDGEVLVVLSGLRGESLVWTDLDAWRRRLMAVAVGAGRRAAALAAVDVEVRVSERRPIGIGRRRRGDVPCGRARRDHRSLRPAVRRPSICRSSTGWRQSPGETGSMTDEARAEAGARLSGR
jgi:hypothetical protein